MNVCIKHDECSIQTVNLSLSARIRGKAREIRGPTFRCAYEIPQL